MDVDGPYPSDYRELLNSKLVGSRKNCLKKQCNLYPSQFVVLLINSSVMKTVCPKNLDTLNPQWG